MDIPRGYIKCPGRYIFEYLDDKYYKNLVQNLLTRSNSIINYTSSTVSNIPIQHVHHPKFSRLHLYNIEFPFFVSFFTNPSKKNRITEDGVNIAKVYMLFITLSIYGFIPPNKKCERVFKCMYDRVYSSVPTEEDISDFLLLVKTSEGYKDYVISSYRARVFSEKKLKDLSPGDCPVCYNPFDNNRYRKTECGKCHYKLCSECLARYTLERTTDVLCMNEGCDELYNEMFLLEMFDDRFKELYKSHRKVILWDENLSEFGDAEEYVLFEKEKRNIAMRVCVIYILIFMLGRQSQSLYPHDFLNLYQISREKYNTIRGYLNEHGIKDISEKTFQELWKDTTFSSPVNSLGLYRIFNIIFSSNIGRISKLSPIIFNKSNEYEAFNEFLGVDVCNTFNIMNNTPIDLHSKKNRRVIVCPLEECQGVLSNEDNACITCGVQVCRRCGVVKISDDHECKPEDVKSMKMFLESTDMKKCPMCPAYVYRIEGCDHMYCMNCKTGFDWVSGRILSNAENTNPHMYADLRANRIAFNPNTANCNEGLDRFLFSEIVNTKVGAIATQTLLNTEAVIMRLSVNHVNSLPDYEDTSIHNRVLYILNEISKEEFINRAYESYMNNIRNTQRILVINTLRSLVLGLLYECMDPNTTVPRIKEILYFEIPRIFKVINKGFHRIDTILEFKDTIYLRYTENISTMINMNFPV